jgi:hypothetical protein
MAGLASALLAGGGVACGWSWIGGVEGDGKTTAQRRQARDSFDAVEARGFLDVHVKVGPAASVSVTIDANLQPYVDVRVQGSSLVIEEREPLRPHGPAFADVTLPVLRAASTSGSGAMAIDGSSGGALRLATSGSGSVRWHGEVERLEVSTSGSGTAVLAGRAGELRASTSGSGAIEGAALTVSGDADVSTSGSGRVEIRLAGGALRARTSGSGDVLYAGEARAVDAHVSGSGRVRRR